jgi:SAM-dependent methyltransferase
MTVFWDIHSGLPREGPGNSACVARALEMAQPLPVSIDVLDIGCGPGGQTMDLALLLPGASIVALDAHRPFLQELERRASIHAVLDRVQTLCGDMREMSFAPESFDLIWCEGAAYFVGLETALRSWSSLLKPGGKLALTEVVWLRPNPPDAVTAHWSDYPEMRDIDAVRAIVEASTFRRLGDFVLPEAAWWDNYYTPMEARLPRLREKHRNDPEALRTIADAQREIDIYQGYSSFYGYLFIVLQKQASQRDAP